MRPNIVALNQLIEERFNGNKAKFAAELCINRSQVSLILNQNGKGAGSSFFGALINYCDCEGLNFRDYIFLKHNVKKMTIML
ncbi:MAG: hypothetical protein ACM3QZ_09320 [Solirubrobacterales bacterium]